MFPWHPMVPDHGLGPATSGRQGGPTWAPRFLLEKTWRKNPANLGKHNTKTTQNPSKNPSRKIWKSNPKIARIRRVFFVYWLVPLALDMAAFHPWYYMDLQGSAASPWTSWPSFSLWEAIGMFEINTSKRRNAYVLHIKLVLKNQLGGVLLDVLLAKGFFFPQ